jgi:hypothetical protein
MERSWPAGSGDSKVILRDTSTWQSKGRPILCGSPIPCIRFSSTGLLAVATDKGIQIWDLDLAHLDSNNAHNNPLAWTRDGAQRKVIYNTHPCHRFGSPDTTVRWFPRSLYLDVDLFKNWEARTLQERCWPRCCRVV